MNWLDILLLLIFAVSMVSGAMKGLSRIILGLAATLLGIVLAVWFYASVGAYFLPYVSSETIANFCGFVSILLEGLDGASADEILAVPSDLVDRIGMPEILGMLRVHGLNGVLRRLKSEVARSELIASAAHSRDTPELTSVESKP